MKAAIYARVSTEDQNCTLQLAECREFCIRQGWEIAGEYVDEGWSGAKASRPAFDRLLADAGRQKFGIVVVWKLDRWGRSLTNCLASIERLAKAGTSWVSCTQPELDTRHSSPTGRLLLHIIAAVAEFEREMIRERCRAGMKQAIAQGKRCSRPQAVYDREEAARMRRGGMRIRAIAEALGVSKSVIQRGLAA